MNRFVTWMSATAVLALTASPLAAQTDTTFTYQGSLSEGGAVADGPHDIDVGLWDAVSGGVQIGSTQSFPTVPVAGGLFTLELDFGANALDNSDRFLELTVNTVTLSPRQPVTRAPYSIQTRGIFVDADDYVGIGTSTPTFPLHVEANESAIYGRSTLVGFGVYGECFSGSGVHGFHNVPSGAGSGVSGKSNSTSGRGVSGVATASTGTTYGLYARSDSVSGRGVFGRANASSGANYGVYGESFSTSGHGVFGRARASSGVNDGVRGVSDSSSGRAVSGYASATSGVNYGGQFVSNSTTGRGVYGEANASSGVNYGGNFRSFSTSGCGLYGEGVANSGTNYGVYGRSNSTNGFDFYAAGIGVNYGAASSIRWKSNVRNIDNPLQKIARLRGVYYDWDEEHGGQHDLGMIAEEVGKVLPEIVNYEENGIDAIGMDYSKMTPLLVEAVNALRAEKDAEIAALNERLAMLEKLLLNRRIEVEQMEYDTQIRSKDGTMIRN